jgi:uncharacterized protein
MDSTLIQLQNPWWEDGKKIHQDQHLMEVEGKPYFFVPALVQDFNFGEGDIAVIRGPRQVGKTTSIKMLIRKLLESTIEARSILYLSCESFTSFQELETHLIEFFKEHSQTRTFVFLDEISFVPQWQRAILAVANMGLSQKSSLVLTGSNARDLKQSTERLPGRRGKGKDFSLYPLSVFEMSRLECFQNKSFEQVLDIYYAIGGFPRAVADFVNYGLVTDETYQIYRNWIIGDASRYALKQELLKQILYRIAETVASRVTWPKLIEHSPVKSHETALEYVEHLQDSFLCHLLFCFDPDQEGPAFSKARKIYFIDPLLYYLAFSWKDGTVNISQSAKEKLKDSSLRGRFFESIVVNHAARLERNIFYWYSSKNKKEVDLLVKKEAKLKLFDIKLTSTAPYRALNQQVNIIDPPMLQNLIHLL